MLKNIFCKAFLSILILMFFIQTAEAKNLEKEAIILCDDEGKIIFAQNKDEKLIPASILKILTSLTAFHYLNKDYKFKTQIYLRDKNSLLVKGFADPFLNSEALDKIALQVFKKIGKAQVKNLILDSSAFEKINIDGVNEKSNEPYDAPNLALSANFNTIFFANIKNKYFSMEEETPLIPFAEQLLKEQDKQYGRISIQNENNEALFYFGHLFKYFLEKNEIEVQDVVTGEKSLRDNLILEYESEFILEDIVQKLLKFSNNFVANQLFLTIGAKVYGYPANLDKSVNAFKLYLKNYLGIYDAKIVEGSGISRKNKFSANDFLKILNSFKKYHSLLNFENEVYFKTGTLNQISTIAGYIKRKDKLYPFVVILNDSTKSAKDLIGILKNKII